MNISIIIPHKGREELLLLTVLSIITQSINISTLEIFIITQNKELNILEDIDSSSVNITIFHLSEDKSISALRNYGAYQSKGKYLAFLDADVELPHDWFATMIKVINENKNRIIVSSIQRNSLEPSEVEQVRTALNNIHKNSNVDSLPGSNLFMRKDDFENSLKFPEHMKTCEDIYFTSELAKKGKLFVTQETSHIHLGEDKSYQQLFKKEIWRGQSNLQSIKGRDIPLREIPSFIIPIALLILFITTLFTVIYNNSLTILSVLILFAPIIVYSLRLYKLAKHEVQFWHVFKFYIVYFPARAFGTLGGLFKSFSNSGIK
jgi:glycosyltransferase involved in cell wall biosynthesis